MVDELKYSISKQHYRKRIIIQTFVAIVIFVSGIIAGSGGTVALLKNMKILRPPRPFRPPRMMASEIAEKIGSSKHSLLRELDNRERFLNQLVKMNIVDQKKVSNAIMNYYEDHITEIKSSK